MQLQAFNYSQVIKSFPVKITSITTYNDMIFVAGKKGTFIQYIRKNGMKAFSMFLKFNLISLFFPFSFSLILLLIDVDRDTEYKSVYQIANHKENFSQCKSGATQLLIVPEWDTLFAVNDNGIAVCLSSRSMDSIRRRDTISVILNMLKLFPFPKV